MNNVVSLVINNRRVTGWKTFSVSRSIDSLCGNFDVSLTNIPSDITSLLLPQSSCEIYIDDDQILKGTIYNRSRFESKKSTALRFSGRDATSALVDCSAISATNYWQNASIYTIVNDICKPFGITVSSSATTQKIKTFTIQTGETAADTIQRACRQFGLIAYTDRKGQLVINSITQASTPVASNELRRPGNIKSTEEDINYEDSFSTLYVKGQDIRNGKAWTKEQLQKTAIASDSNVTLYRPKVIISDAVASKDELQKRANWEVQYRAGSAKSYRVETRGFRQFNDDNISSNPLWEPGYRVTLAHDDWDIYEQKIISSVTHFFSDAGSHSSLLLKDPRTYLSDPLSKVPKL